MCLFYVNLETLQNDDSKFLFKENFCITFFAISVHLPNKWAHYIVANFIKSLFFEDKQWIEACFKEREGGHFVVSRIAHSLV